MTLTFAGLLAYFPVFLALVVVLYGVFFEIPWKAIYRHFKPRKLSTLMKIAREYYSQPEPDYLCVARGKTQFFCVAASLARDAGKLTTSERNRVRQFAGELVQEISPRESVLVNALCGKVDGDLNVFAAQIWDAVIDKLEADGK